MVPPAGRISAGVEGRVTDGNMKQSDLDVEMVQQGIARQRRRIEDAQRKSKESWTTYGQRLISGAVKPVGDAIARAVDNLGIPRHSGVGFVLIKDLDPHVAALIGLQTAIDSISRRQKASQTYIAVGREIEWEIQARRFSRAYPYLLQKIRQHWFRPDHAHRVLGKTRQESVSETANKATGKILFEGRWSDADCLRVGHAIVETIREQTGLLDRVTLRTSARRTDTFIIPTPETEAFIAKVRARTELLEPVYLPMVVPPYHWKGPKEGGYATDGQPICKVDRANVLDQLTPHQMPEVYAGLNYLQGVPYQINPRVLAVYQWAWEHSIVIGDMPPTRDHELPPLPPKARDAEDAASDRQKALMREWWLIAGPLKQANIEARSRRLHYAKIKHLSEKFQNQNIFFPLTCDFRGRIYTQPSFLTYQGCDLAKAMLQFAFGKPVSTPSARKWLKVQGANSWGVKGTFDERCRWVDDHAKQIIASAKDPIEDEWWRQADEPWQFLAFCFEAQAISRDPSHCSHLVCWQDGTNNGLQVLSLLFRDEVGGVSTNCMHDGRPRDIYADVAEETLRILRLDASGESGIDEVRRDFARGWLQFGIDRSTTKRCVMIVPYSGTLYSAVKYVREWMKSSTSESRPSPWKDPTKPIGYLTKVIWTSIGNTVIKAREAMDWLRKVGEACVDADVDATWTSPTGFLCVQDYPDWSKSMVRTSLMRRTYAYQLRERTARRNRRKHVDAISPNWVHCLDAAALIRTALRVRDARVESMASVHDSIGVLAADGDVLASELRLAWAGMFEEDLVAGLRREIEARIGDRLPDPPTFGSMPPSAVIDSPYFFS